MNELFDKIASRGVNSLEDKELLEVLTEDSEITDTLLEELGGSLGEFSRKEPARLRMIGGMGRKKAARLMVAAEFGRRVALEEAHRQDIITESDDIVKIFRPQLEGLLHEECWAVFLTSSNRIIERMRISQGGVQSTVVDHRLIIKRALELLATQIILIHNHPSGAALASQQDKILTKKVEEAARLFDIRLLDHIIISREGDYSFRREGFFQ